MFELCILGQIYNLRLSLLAEESPADLAKRNPITMKRRYKSAKLLRQFLVIPSVFVCFLLLFTCR